MKPPSEHVLRFEGGEVLVVSPEARRLVAWLLRAGVRLAANRDGITPPALATVLLDAFSPSSAPELEELPQERDLSASMAQDLIGTKEIATMLGTTDRNARARCRRGSFDTAIQVGRCWFADRAEIERIRVHA